MFRFAVIKCIQLFKYSFVVGLRYIEVVLSHFGFYVLSESFKFILTISITIINYIVNTKLEFI